MKDSFRPRWKMGLVGATLFGAALLGAGCSSSSPQKVPDVVGQNLDQAEGTLSAQGIGNKVYGGGAFGIVIKSDWTVCSQNPLAGNEATSVKLVVARSCS
jgi:hypothetical protein